MTADGYPQYAIDVTLDNGVTFSTLFSAAVGLPTVMTDELAAVAAVAIRNFNWQSLALTPVATSATVVVTRQDIVNTNVPLGS